MGVPPFLCAAVLSLIVIAGGVAFARPPDPPIFSAVPHYPSNCYLPPDSGMCSGDKAPPDDNTVEFKSAASGGRLQTHFYFDATTEQCYQFSTQNCGGNENRFDSQTVCETHCRLRR